MAQSVRSISTEPDEDFRARHVGASEVAALFDASPYLSRFELWHRKNGTIATPAFNAIHDDGSPENERIWCGVRLEQAILDMACERWGYADVQRHAELSNGQGLGAHPDALAYCPERKSRGYVEIKMADWLVRKGWGDEPPMNYLLQSQTGQGLAKATWGDVIVLVGGNKLERFQYDFRPKVYLEIERRVKAFWQSVAEGRAPKPDYARDGAALKEVYVDQSDETVDLAGDNRAAICAAEYLAAAEDVKLAQARKDAAQAELVDKIKDAAVGFAEGFTIKATAVKATPDREAKPGEIIKGRKGYRRFAVKELEN